MADDRQREATAMHAALEFAEAFELFRANHPYSSLLPPSARRLITAFLALREELSAVGYGELRDFDNELSTIGAMVRSERYASVRDQLKYVEEKLAVEAAERIYTVATRVQADVDAGLVGPGLAKAYVDHDADREERRAPGAAAE